MRGRRADVAQRRRRFSQIRSVSTASSANAGSVRAESARTCAGRSETGRAFGEGWRLFENHVRIGPAETERADAGEASRRQRRATAVPSRESPAGSAPQLDVRVRLAEVQVRRNLAVLQREHDLDEPGDAGRRLEMADVGLDRSDDQRTDRRRGRRRAPPRARAARSDRPATCRCRGPRRSRRRRPRHPPSASAVRITACCASSFGAVSPLLRPSWLTADAANERDRCGSPSATRVGQPLENDDAAAFAADVAVGRGVEGLAASVGREHLRAAAVDRRPRARASGWRRRRAPSGTRRFRRL